jgi:hypothetical protein
MFAKIHPLVTTYKGYSFNDEWNGYNLTGNNTLIGKC